MTNEELILKELREIKDRLDRLENANKLFGPFTPIPNEPPPWLPKEALHKCSKCGLEMKGVMGYCCPRLDCPSGMGPVVC